MRTLVPSILLSIALLWPVHARATTWVESKATDPISGRSVEVQEPASYGSYIYQAPGKEDQVFWPFTTDDWLWFNPRTGYGAFGGDFEELAGTELERVRAWLAEQYDARNPPVTRLEKLAWLERLYAAREMDDAFWCHFYRLMAFETSGSDPVRSLDYVRKALPLLEKELAATQDPDKRISTLYLLGEYHRRLGHRDASRSYFEQVRSATYRTQDGETKIGVPYFNELIDEREALHESASAAPSTPDR